MRDKQLTIDNIFGQPVVFLARSKIADVNTVQDLKRKVSKKLGIETESVCFVECNNGVDLLNETKVVVRENSNKLGIFRYLDIETALNSLVLHSNKSEFYLIIKKKI